MLRQKKKQREKTVDSVAKKQRALQIFKKDLQEKHEKELEK